MIPFAKVAQISLAVALPTSIILLYWWYKNKTDEDAFGHRRVVTTRNTLIEVKVPKNAVATVIGRQGSMIKQVQKETGASMHFHDKEEAGGGDNLNREYRTLVIRGSAESAHQAELMILQMIAELPNLITEEIEVPSYAIGRIIGKGGVTIRDLSATSGAKIVIDRNESYSTDYPRTVTLTGTRQQINAAMELIQIKLEEEQQFRMKQVEDSRPRFDHFTVRNLKEPPKINKVTRKDESWDAPSGRPSVPRTVPEEEKHQNDVPIDVYVSAVENPSHFWVQMIGAKGLQLEQLQVDITQFAASDEAQENYRVQEVQPGELVAAKFTPEDMTYYRAQVLATTPDGKVDLYFVDYGDNSYADKSDLFRLRSDFTSLPYQATECALAGVKPFGGSWSEEAITCFESLVHCAQWRRLAAQVVSYQHVKGGKRWPVVQLVDSSDSRVVDIGAEMIRQGYAEPVVASTIKNQDSEMPDNAH